VLSVAANGGHYIIAALTEDCTVKLPIKFHSTGKINCNIVENCILLVYYAKSSGITNISGQTVSTIFRGQESKRSVSLVRNYHYLLHNNLEEHISHLLHGGSLKSCNIIVISKGVRISMLVNARSTWVIYKSD